MGFLKSLFRATKKKETTKKKEAAKKNSAPKHEPTHTPKEHGPQKAPSARKCIYTLTLEGDSERRVYTYDGAPLKGTRKGSVFYADVITEPVSLHSDVTGSDWDSSSGGVALAVNGMLFGMTSTLERTFKELAEAGYAVKVKAKRLGMYCEGIPEIVLMIPDPNEVFHWRDACRGLGREVPFEERHSEECERAAELENERHRLSRSSGLDLPVGVDGDVFFINDEDWPGAKPSNGLALVEISTELIPTPKGSSAKPHIVVSVSGEAFVEVSARNHQYSAMARHVGEKPYASTCQKHLRDDGTFCWKVTIVYFCQEESK